MPNRMVSQSAFTPQLLSNAGNSLIRTPATIAPQRL